MAEGILSLQSFKNMTDQERKKIKKDDLIKMLLHTEIPDVSDLTVAIRQLTELVDGFRKEQAATSESVIAMKVELEQLRDSNRKMQTEFSARINQLEQRSMIKNIEIVGLSTDYYRYTDGKLQNHGKN